LHARAHDVAHGLVDAARLVPVNQVGGALGEAVGDLVARHVQGGQRARVAPVAVAVVHLVAVPEGVDVVGVDVDVGAQLCAVPVDGVAAEDVPVEVGGHLGAVHGVHRALLPRRVGGLAPGAVVVGHLHGAGAAGAVLGVADLHALAAGGVQQLLLAVADV